MFRHHNTICLCKRIKLHKKQKQEQIYAMKRESEYLLKMNKVISINLHSSGSVVSLNVHIDRTRCTEKSFSWYITSNIKCSIITDYIREKKRIQISHDEEEKWCVSSECTICRIGKIWHRIAWMMKLWAVNKRSSNQTDVLVCNIFFSIDSHFAGAGKMNLGHEREKYEMKFNCVGYWRRCSWIAFMFWANRCHLVCPLQNEQHLFIKPIANGVANWSQGKLYK